jgi:hypothetical protein
VPDVDSTDQAKGKLRGSRGQSILLVLMAALLLTWAGVVAGAVFAIIPAASAGDLIIGLGWTVVISAAAGVALSAIYTAVANATR